jgi:hypothetical protein
MLRCAVDSQKVAKDVRGDGFALLGDVDDEVDGEVAGWRGFFVEAMACSRRR